ncbi:hypothetical protein ABIA53_002018 [Pseudomonas monsensis]
MTLKKILACEELLNSMSCMLEIVQIVYRLDET